MLVRGRMRSSLGPVLVLLGLATTVVLVLLLVQTIGMRNELERTRADVSALRGEVAERDEAITAVQLRRELDELESGIRDWLIATGADRGPGTGTDVGTPAGGSGSSDLVDRLDEVLLRINELNDRVDEICRNVPVC